MKKKKKNRTNKNSITIERSVFVHFKAMNHRIMPSVNKKWKTLKCDNKNDWKIKNHYLFPLDFSTVWIPTYMYVNVNGFDALVGISRSFEIISYEVIARLIPLCSSFWRVPKKKRNAIKLEEFLSFIMRRMREINLFNFDNSNFYLLRCCFSVSFSLARSLSLRLSSSLYADN